MKRHYYVAILTALLVAGFLYSLNFSTEERVIVSATVTDSVVHVNKSYIVVKNIYNFTVIAYYGNLSAILYPGESATFPYQTANTNDTNNTYSLIVGSNCVILEAKGFKEIIEVSDYEEN
mgnify:CR=1 FL=1